MSEDTSDVLAIPVVVDTRTRDEKIGSIPTKRGAKPAVIENLSKEPTKKNAMPALTTAEKALRGNARKLALDYCEQMILNLVDIAMNSTQMSARVDASKQILHMGLGRPSTVHITDEGSLVIPNFTINFGGVAPQPVTITGDFTTSIDAEQLEQFQLNEYADETEER